VKSYPSYKESGVEWIGGIPSHWAHFEFKFLLQLLTDFEANGSFASVKQNVKILETDGPVWYVRMTDLQNKNHRNEKCKYCDIPSYEFLEKTKLNGGELLITKRGEIGKVYLFPVSMGLTTLAPNAYLVRTNPKRLMPNFGFYFFISDAGQKSLKLIDNSTTIGAIYKEDVKNLKIIVPPIPEQKNIVEHLDSETQKIDKLIGLTEQKIELLKEQRTALINQSVTKGLNPKVEMKDSGVEWIGEIPSNWKFLSLWLIVRNSQLGGNYISGNDAELYPIIKMGNIGRGKIVLDKVEYLGDKQNFDTSHFLMNGDFLFNTRNSRDLVGKVTLWRDELESSLYNSNILRVKFNSGINDAYMSYLFNTKSFLDVLRLISKGTTNVSAIYYKDLSKLKVCIPPTDEQIQIVTLLASENQKIDSTIEKESQRIKLLKEYRQALISEVVTGKIDVRDEVVT
jgi:type I restriction enzyme, S subunit